MISGIGVDLVDKYRFLDLIERFGNRFPNKILSPEEYEEYLLAVDKPSFFCKKDLQQKRLCPKL